MCRSGTPPGRWALLGAALAALAGCVTGVRVAHWDAESQRGLVRAALGSRAYWQAVRAGRLMDLRCGEQPVTVLEGGFELSEPYRSWAGPDYGARPGSVYYWVFACLPPEQPVDTLACAPAAADRAGTPSASKWLELASPATGERAYAPLVELRGTAGARGGSGQELAIVLDLSESTLIPSGVDVDGDGPEGRTGEALLTLLETEPSVDRILVQHAREGDFDDSVLLAVLTAAKLLIDRIDLAKNRVGIVAFSSHAGIVAPVGSDRAALVEALRALRVGASRYLRSTDYGGALRMARGALGRREDRPKTIVLLSDLRPPAPLPAEVMLGQAGLEVLRLAAEGTRLQALALGPLGADAQAVWHQLAECAGGGVEALERPGDVVFALRSLDLVGLRQVLARNETTGGSARALRVFPTGEFDGFVDLAPGRNVVHVEATFDGGARAELRREIDFESASASPAELERLRALVQRRSLEIELWDEMKRTRRRQQRVLDLSLDETAGTAR